MTSQPVTTHTCSECGQAVPEPEPVTVTIPAKPWVIQREWEVEVDAWFGEE